VGHDPPCLDAAISGAFVEGSDGVILGGYVDPDYRRRMEVEDLLEALRADAISRADQAR
jgi:ribosomal protein S18 acetylase RimI-like enzyme